MKGMLKFVGGKWWPWPQEHIDETRKRGPSVRIAPDSIPDLETPYPIIFVHPRGTFHVTTEGMNIEDLYTEMCLEGHVPGDEIGEPVIYIEGGLPTLQFIGLFRHAEKWDKTEFNRLVEKYGIEFAPAATHYSYITGTQVVVGDDGTGLDLVKELNQKGVGVEPVWVIRVKEGKNEA